MKKYTIYNGIENLTKKEIINLASTEKKAVRFTLSDFALSLESAYKQLTATGSTARNTANAVKGQYKTAVNVVSNCFPLQSVSGELLVKTKDGYKLKKLSGAGSAYSVVKLAVSSFVDFKAGRKECLIKIIPEAEIIRPATEETK